jgi:uncharacterized protein (DUF2236 family)
MNPIITRDLLETAGINLENQDIDALLDHLNQELEERVGAEITASLSDEQLKEMLDIQAHASDEQLAEWLTTNVPELEQITQDEVDIILGELAENAEGINDAAK